MTGDGGPAGGGVRPQPVIPGGPGGCPPGLHSRPSHMADGVLESRAGCLLVSFVPCADCSCLSAAAGAVKAGSLAAGVLA